MDHVLLTRFNLPSAGVESTFRTRDGWLEGRVALFERYCLPSVARQSHPNAKWLIYFDPDSPHWLKQWIASSCNEQFVPVFRAEVDRTCLLSDIERLFPSKSRHLMTTNLDNDDGLGRDFVARLQKTDRTAPRRAVYLTRGLIKDASGVYLRRDRENAFCSVLETWDEPVTCWTDWHNRLQLSMPMVQIGGAPAWLQVVHGTNVSNRVRGMLVSPDRYRDDFVGLDDVPAAPVRQVWADRVARMPVRTTRDACRTTVRRTAVAVLGKDGFNAAKARLAGVKAASS
jgi:hypothetical protein